MLNSKQQAQKVEPKRSTTIKYITRQNANVPLKADILKAPHHGTEVLAENEFFETVRPSVMVVPSPKALWLSERSRRVRLLACAEAAARAGGKHALKNNHRRRIIAETFAHDVKLKLDRECQILIADRKSLFG